MILSWDLPIKTVSEINVYEHWSKSAKRHKLQKKRIKQEWILKRPKFDLPAHIVLTRMSPRKLDYVNLVASLKWIQDGVAECIFPGLAPGRADDEGKGLTWHFKQETAKKQSVKIQIYQSSPE